MWPTNNTLFITCKMQPASCLQRMHILWVACFCREHCPRSSETFSTSLWLYKKSSHHQHWCGNVFYETLKRLIDLASICQLTLLWTPCTDYTAAFVCVVFLHLGHTHLTSSASRLLPSECWGHQSSEPGSLGSLHPVGSYCLQSHSPPTSLPFSIRRKTHCDQDSSSLCVPTLSTTGWLVGFYSAIYSDNYKINCRYSK